MSTRETIVAQAKKNLDSASECIDKLAAYDESARQGGVEGGDTAALAKRIERWGEKELLPANFRALMDVVNSALA